MSQRKNFFLSLGILGCALFFLLKQTGLKQLEAQTTAICIPDINTFYVSNPPNIPIPPGSGYIAEGDVPYKDDHLQAEFKDTVECPEGSILLSCFLSSTSSANTRIAQGILPHGERGCINYYHRPTSPLWAKCLKVGP